MDSLNKLSLFENTEDFNGQYLNESFNSIILDNYSKNEFDLLFPQSHIEKIFSDKIGFFDLSKIDLEEIDNQHGYTINPINNSISETSISDNNKNISFKTVLHQKRGRKEKNEKKGKKYHGAGDFDNIQRKIQVSFINFLINLANDAIHSVLGKESKFIFKDIQYIYKKVVNHNYVENLKKSRYSDIIQIGVSAKMGSYNENLNKETYLQVSKISPELKNFFDMNYLYIFQKYFCEIKDNLKIVDFDGLKIKLSSNTKGLYDLLKKNTDRKEIFLDAIKNIYFREINYLNKKEIEKKNLFITSK